MEKYSTVYFTKEISPGAFVKPFSSLGVEPQGKVAIKISTRESAETSYLRPQFIKPLI